VPMYTYTTIDHPSPATSTSAQDINNTDQIVGSYKDAIDADHGFLLSAGFSPRSTIPWQSPT
jgi:hypothetical protein